MSALTISDATLALAGGMSIGLASLFLLWSNGRIAGISGIVTDLMTGPRNDVAWRATFLIGLMLGALIYITATGDVPIPRGDFPRPALVLAGLLVGYGSSLGNGCTSGHGVCGIGRFSRRSLTATATFLGVAMLTTTLVRHVLGWL